MSASTRKFFVGGNWKCNGSREFVKSMISILNSAELPSKDAVEVVIAPPTVYLDMVSTFVKSNIGVAAQNCHNESKGAFTGAISAEMLQDIGVPYVIIGHSERRKVFGESDALIGKKVKHAQEVGLIVIACIGEQLEEREAGRTNEVVLNQLKHIAENTVNWANIVIAYEPVWAIGTGRTASPDQAQEVHAEIRRWVAENVSAEVAGGVRVIYGGSVTKDNCHELATRPDVDGFLVGGASLQPQFINIICSHQVKASL